MSALPIISLIAAVATDGAIGKGNAMPWHISDDLKYFKRVTFGKCVIMGRKTWESLGCKPLPGRDNIIISRTLFADSRQDNRTSQLSEGSQAPLTSRVHYVSSLGSALDLARTIAVEAGQNEIFVIGGGNIYRQAMEKASRIYLTRVYTSVPEADVFFPEIDMEKWRIATRSGIAVDEKSGLNYEFLIYER
ncbi:MAG: dihydrofolate reductase [Bacteroidales bacterium]|jgi:dihydrofolate reductase|nr:dihydrofolate reductase [Bacteroidales bacterium]